MTANGARTKRLTLDDIRAAHPEAKPAGQGYSMRCPAHDDHEASLSVSEGKDGRLLWHCHAGCDQEAVGIELGVLHGTGGGRMNGAQKSDSKRTRRIVNTYPYRDAMGSLVYEAVRYEPKGFAQRRHDGVWSLAGIDPLPYRLPELVAAVERGELIFITEGEKDADALAALGCAATTNSGGAGKWRAEFAKYFSGARGVVIPDNDPTGEDHALDVAGSLKRTAASIKIVRLPGLPLKGDVSDFLDAGGTVEALLALVEAEPEWMPAEVIEADALDTDAALAGFQLTDDGNGRAIELLHSDRLQYRHGIGDWLEWTGSIWQPDRTGSAARLAVETIKARGAAAFKVDGVSKAHREALATFAIRCENQGKVNAALDAAKRQPKLASTADRWDRDPLLLGCDGATIDLMTGKGRKPSPGDRITRMAGARWEPGATCKRWLRFINEIAGGNPELILFLWRAIGYTLTGLTREQVFFLLHGSGSNGKSLFLKMLSLLQGDYGRNADFETFQPKKYQGGAREDLARLAGARYVPAKESADMARLDEATIKGLTGGDIITARNLYSGSFEFTPQFKIWLATNHKPIITGDDHGIWRRVRLIPFVQQFSPDQEPDLEATLIGELSGILNWAVQGALEWQKHGLGCPDVVRAATDEYRNDSDIFGRFLVDRCEVSGSADAGATELYTAFCEWSDANGERRLSQTVFGRRLRDRGFEKKTTMKGVRWLGIRLA
jgi:putative DNA primase/helicase